jgi:CheY-like chemotaxis protein
VETAAGYLYMRRPIVAETHLDSIPTVLCIDDFKPGLQTRKSLLEQFGFNVLIASSGAEGLELLNHHNVDAIVLDYRMPGMNGEELAIRVRKVFKNIPLLLLSGAVMEIPSNLRKIVDCQLMKGDPPGMLIEALDSVTRTTGEQRRSARKNKKSVASVTPALLNRKIT